MYAPCLSKGFKFVIAFMALSLQACSSTESDNKPLKVNAPVQSSNEAIKKERTRCYNLIEQAKGIAQERSGRTVPLTISPALTDNNDTDFFFLSAYPAFSVPRDRGDGTMCPESLAESELTGR